jgi:hypothetical protein
VWLLDGRNRLDALEVALGRPVRVVCHVRRGRGTSRKAWTIETDGDDGWTTSITDYLSDASVDVMLHPHVRVLGGNEDVDPLAYVISANIRRRHLSAEDKDRLIVQLLKADPTKSNRTVAKLTDTSHPHVAKVREQAEKIGDVETVTTSIDTQGRRQPSHKPRNKPAEVHQPAGVDDDLAAATLKRAEHTIVNGTALAPIAEITTTEKPVIETDHGAGVLARAWAAADPEQRMNFLKGIDPDEIVKAMPDGLRSKLQALALKALSTQRLVKEALLKLPDCKPKTRGRFQDLETTMQREGLWTENANTAAKTKPLGQPAGQDPAPTEALRPPPHFNRPRCRARERATIFLL